MSKNRGQAPPFGVSVCSYCSYWLRGLDMVTGAPLERHPWITYSRDGRAWRCACGDMYGGWIPEHFASVPPQALAKATATAHVALTEPRSAERVW